MMKPAMSPIICDGCGQPATPEHFAVRVQRLELATRFRPIHIGILFFAMAPAARIEDDFYSVERSSEALDRFLTALGISAPVRHREASTLSSESSELATARLNEFQHRGHYLAYLSECPLETSGEGNSAPSLVARRSTTLVRRIQFNYKPKHIALLGAEMTPLIQILKEAGLGELLLLDQSGPLAIPVPGDSLSEARFQEALSEKTTKSSAAAMV